MNKLIIFFILLPFYACGQDSLTSGQYQELNLAFDQESNIITGFYENYTGYDEATKKPRFSCIFYLEGKLKAGIAAINTYFPVRKAQDKIVGQLIIINKNEVTVHLPQEHGGCWNVETFAGKPEDFKLEQAKPWIQIRYAINNKVFFYSDKSETKKLKAYVVMGDILYIEKKEGHWLYCTYLGDRTTQGWIKLEDVNTPE